MLEKDRRLTSKEIGGLSNGKSVFGTLISMRYKKNGRLKFAVSVSKRSVANAVDRNRVRRRVYSLLRLISPRIKEPVSAMLLPKKEFKDMPIDSLRGEVEDLFKKAGLI